MILFNSLAMQTIGSILIALVAVGILVLGNILIKKKEEQLQRYQLLLIYLGFFIMIVGAVLLEMVVWGFDFQPHLTNYWGDFETFILGRIGSLIGSVVTIFIAFFIVKLSHVGLMKVGKKGGVMQRRKQTIAKVTMSVIKYFIVVVTIIVVLAIWDVNVLPALAGLGIMGLVIGLGAQKFINDLIAGLFIVFEHHFDVGDVVEVKGFKGTVIDIGLKTCKIKNWKGEVKILNNGDVTDITNFSLDSSTAIIDFGIAYREDVQKTIDVLKQELPKLKNKYPQILDDPTVVGVIALNSSSVDMRVIVKTANEQHYEVERGTRQFIKEVLDEHSIEIPFPQVVVHQAKS